MVPGQSQSHYHYQCWLISETEILWKFKCIYSRIIFKIIVFVILVFGTLVNTKNGQHFADNIFKCILSNENSLNVI